MDQNYKKEKTWVMFSEMFHFPERSSKHDKVTNIKSWIKGRCFKKLCEAQPQEDVHGKILFFVDGFHMSNWST